MFQPMMRTHGILCGVDVMRMMPVAHQHTFSRPEVLRQGQLEIVIRHNDAPDDFRLGAVDDADFGGWHKLLIFLHYPKRMIAVLAELAGINRVRVPELTVCVPPKS